MPYESERISKMPFKLKVKSPSFERWTPVFETSKWEGNYGKMLKTNSKSFTNDGMTSRGQEKGFICANGKFTSPDIEETCPIKEPREAGLT